MLDLIEKPMGVIDLLDEQCKFPRVRHLDCASGNACRRVHHCCAGQSLQYMALLSTLIYVFIHVFNHGVESSFSPPPQATNSDYANRLYQSNLIEESNRFTKPKLSQTAFTIEHYAGGVTYNTDNFLVKNRDFVVAEHQLLLEASSEAYVAGLFPPEPEPEQPAGVRCCKTDRKPKLESRNERGEL